MSKIDFSTYVNLSDSSTFDYTKLELADDINTKQFYYVAHRNVKTGTDAAKGVSVSVADIVDIVKTEKKAKDTAKALLNPAFKLTERIKQENMPNEPEKTGYFCIDIDMDASLSDADKQTMIDSLSSSPCVIFAARTFSKGVWALCRGDNSLSAHKALTALALSNVDERRIVDYGDEQKRQKNEPASPTDAHFLEWHQLRVIPHDASVRLGRGAYVGYQFMQMPTIEQTQTAFKAHTFAKLAYAFMQQIPLNADDLSRCSGAAAALVLLSLAKPSRFGFGTSEAVCTVHGNMHAVALSTTRIGKSTSTDTIKDAILRAGLKLASKGAKTGESIETLVHSTNTRKDADGQIKLVDERKRILIIGEEAGSGRGNAKMAHTLEQRDKAMRQFMDGFIMSDDSAGNTLERAGFAVPVEGAIYEIATVKKFAAAIQGEDRESGVSARRYEFAYVVPDAVLDKIAHGGRKGFLMSDRDRLANWLRHNQNEWAQYTPEKPRRLFMTESAYMLASMGASFKYCPDSDYPDMIARLSGMMALARECETSTNKLMIEDADVLAALWVIRGINKSRAILRNEYTFEAKTEHTQFIQDLTKAIDENGGKMEGKAIYMRIRRSGLQLSLADLCERQIIEPILDKDTAGKAPTKSLSYRRWESYELPTPQTKQRTSQKAATGASEADINTRVDAYIDSLIDMFGLPNKSERNNTFFSWRGKLETVGLLNEYAQECLVRLAMQTGLTETEARKVTRAKY